MGERFEIIQNRKAHRRKMALRFKLRKFNLIITSLCLLGISISFYSLYVETRREHDKDYVAMCDISENISCSKAFASRYGTGFGILQNFVDKNSPLLKPNSVYGVIFYAALGLLGAINSVMLSKLQLLMSIASIFASIYLGYILYFVLYNFCVVCVSTYVINVVLLLCVWARSRVLRELYYEERADYSSVLNGISNKKRV